MAKPKKAGRRFSFLIGSTQAVTHAVGQGLGRHPGQKRLLANDSEIGHAGFGVNGCFRLDIDNAQTVNAVDAAGLFIGGARYEIGNRHISGGRADPELVELIE